jgi:hypothetical protein
MKRLAIAAALLAAVALGTLPAAAQFYQGKMITMMINYPPGGNTDTEGRIFQRHLAKHIASNPTIIVNHRPGAGGLVGVNWLGTANAPKDGTLFCFCTLNIVEPLIGGPALKVKYQDFAFIAGVHQWIAGYGRKDIPPGMTKPSDLAKATDVFAAGYNPTTPHDMRSKLTLELLGAKFRMVTGLRSIADINKGILQKEVNFSLSSMPAFMSQTMPTLIKDGTAMTFFYLPLIGPDGTPTKRSKELDALGVPPFADVYKQAHGKAPSGPVWDALVLVSNLSTTMLRAVLMPNGTPKAAVEEMRKAFVAVAEDKDFVAEYKRIIKIEAEMVSAEQGEALFASMNKVRPATTAVLKRVAVQK